VEIPSGNGVTSATSLYLAVFDLMKTCMKVTAHTLTWMRGSGQWRGSPALHEMLARFDGVPQPVPGERPTTVDRSVARHYQDFAVRIRNDNNRRSRAPRSADQA
jgi:hypothetical protein